MTFEELGNRFRSTLMTIGEAVIVLTPGQNPLARNRCWCCFEWAQFELLNIPFSYCVPKVDVLNLIQEMKARQAGFAYYNNIFASINVMKAKASNKNDEKNILELIQKIGVDKVNNIVLNSIKHWFIEVCKQGLKDSTVTTKEKVAILNSHGAIYQALGQYDNALPFYEDAAKLTKIIPNNEEQVATQLLRDTGKKNEARPLGQEAYRVVLKVLGPNHPDTKNYHYWNTV